jgi:hypothetical protein
MESSEASGPVIPRSHSRSLFPCSVFQGCMTDLSSSAPEVGSEQAELELLGRGRASFYGCVQSSVSAPSGSAPARQKDGPPASGHVPQLGVHEWVNASMALL